MSDFDLRRVVNGKAYDTTKSRLVASIARHGSFPDFDSEHTQLFVTEKGNFFLAGFGGAMSRWRRRTRDDDGWVEGHGLEPIDHDEARKLVAKFANEEYDDIFAVEEA